MSFRLDLTVDPAVSLHAAADEQRAAAIEALAAGGSQDEGIHDARKALKKTRALLRLARNTPADDLSRQLNREVRDIGRALSGKRDAQALLETAEKLEQPALAARLRHDTAADQADLRDVTAALAHARQTARNLRTAQLTWNDVIANAARAYRRGRKARAKVRKDPTAERRHALRKRAKDLWYHERLLRDLFPELIKAQAKATHRLTDLLGDDHDLAVLKGDSTTTRSSPTASTTHRSKPRSISVAAHCSTRR